LAFLVPKREGKEDDVDTAQADVTFEQIETA